MASKNTSLPKPRQAALEKIAGQSRDLNREWVPTDDIDLRPLNALEAAHLIVQMKTGSNRSARVAQAGWDALGRSSPFRSTSTADPEPMEADTPDARQSTGKIMHGPYPNRSPQPDSRVRLGTQPAPDEPVSEREQPSAAPPSAHVAGVVKGRMIDNCPDCIHADILNIVAVMYPEIADTVDILTRAKHIERDLKREGANGRTE